MKKLLALLLTLALVFTLPVLASCDRDEDYDPEKGLETLNGKSPEDLYAAALAKVKGLTNYEMTSKQVIKMTAGGQEMTMNQNMITKVDGQDCYLKLDNDTESSANMEMWYVDDWMYVINGITRNKANITYQELTENYMPEGAMGENALMNIPAEWFKDTRFFKDGDLYYIEFIVSGEEYTTFMKSTQLGDMLNGIQDVSYKVYFDENGELGDLITEFDYEVEGIACHAISTSTIKNIGGASITAPTGNFTDVTAAMPR